MEIKHKILLKKLSLRIIVSACIFIISVFLFALIADEVVLENEKILDDKVFAFFDSIVTPGTIQLMRAVTFFGSTQFLLPAYIILASYFFIKKQIANGIKVSVVGIASQALLYVLKQVFHRARPDISLVKNIKTYSFPSGHTFSSLIFCSILVYIIYHTQWKKIYKWVTSFLLLLIALSIGLSRIILKVHYPTDVFASLTLAIAWIICCSWMMRKIEKKI